MKTGRTLVELATEVERQRETRVDYVAPAKALALEPGGADVVMVGLPDTIGINDLAHGQLGDYVGVPKTYYDKMRGSAPALLAQNVNHWLGGSTDKRMARTLDGRLRAFLSDGYRPLDNFDLCEAVLPVLGELNVELVSCEVTERRLYIKAVDKRINRDIPSGRRMGDGTHTIFDTVAPAIIISNSEVGYGQLSVESGVWTRACTNLAVFAAAGMKRRHVGARHDISEGLVHLLSDDTRRATDVAIWKQVRDVVKGGFEEAVFDARLDGIREMTEQPITGNVVKVVDLACKALDIRELEKPSFMRHLIEGGDLTRYGLFNAVTRTAEDLGDYDRATEFERLGGKVIDLAPSEWKRIAEAA